MQCCTLLSSIGRNCQSYTRPALLREVAMEQRMKSTIRCHRELTYYYLLHAVSKGWQWRNQTDSLWLAPMLEDRCIVNVRKTIYGWVERATMWPPVLSQDMENSWALQWCLLNNVQRTLYSAFTTYHRRSKQKLKQGVWLLLLHNDSLWVIVSRLSFLFTFVTLLQQLQSRICTTGARYYT